MQAWLHTQISYSLLNVDNFFNEHLPVSYSWDLRIQYLLWDYQRICKKTVVFFIYIIYV
jgi:hypothetical protein